MSAGEIGVAALWKPLTFLGGIIVTLIGVIWRALTKRMDTVEAQASHTKDRLNRDYHDKNEIDKLMVLHLAPLKDSLDKLNDTILRLNEKMEDKADKDGK